MGISSDGILCFGVSFEEGYEFPWSADEFEGAWEDWWLDHSGFTEEWPDDESLVDDYYKRRKAVLDTFPIGVVLHCSYDYPMYILAVRGTLHKAWRGCPKDLSREDFEVHEMCAQALLDFMAAHGIETDEKPRWILASVYG